jgi:hypothetical protein
MKRKWFVWAAALQLITLMQVTTPAQTLIDLEFNRARVQDVLQVLRRLGDFNIVADPFRSRRPSRCSGLPLG